MAVQDDQPNAAEVRRALEAQKEAAIKLALGGKRYEEFRLLHDPLYRDAVTAAQEAGTPETARQIYQLNLAAAEEQASLNANESLSASQKAIALKQLELEQLVAKAALTGQESSLLAPPLPPEVPRRTYVIRPGDNLTVVSLIYGVPMSAIRQANPNLNLNRLRPGDAVNIPPTMQVPLSAP
jgi:LysM repeat protein